MWHFFLGYILSKLFWKNLRMLLVLFRTGGSDACRPRVVRMSITQTNFPLSSTHEKNICRGGKIIWIHTQVKNTCRDYTVTGDTCPSLFPYVSFWNLKHITEHKNVWILGEVSWNTPRQAACHTFKQLPACQTWGSFCSSLSDISVNWIPSGLNCWSDKANNLRTCEHVKLKVTWSYMSVNISLLQIRLYQQTKERKDTTDMLKVATVCRPEIV